MSSQIDYRLSRLAALRPAFGGSPRTMSSELPFGAAALAERLGASIQSNQFGEHLRLRRWHDHPPSSAFDGGALGNGVMALLHPSAAPQCLDPSQWLFLDTETTGLCGGSGTYAFLIGLAWWEAGGLQVEQLFIRDYSEEHAALEALAARISERPVLVTFNGRTFDWPLLETRYRMTRKIAAPQLVSHIDLLHPARQIWRPKLGSVRLIELEEQVLGQLPWQRGDDIPGMLIPQAYFQYLRSEAPSTIEALVQVFRHNEMDLRGLAALSSKIVELLAQPESIESDALELFGLSRLLRRRGSCSRARDIYERALGAGLPAEADRTARRELASLAKRDGDLPRATSLWTEILGGTRDGLDAYEQLAMYYEHHARQPRRAEDVAREAMETLHQAQTAGHIEAARYRRVHARLEHRIARLSRCDSRGATRPASRRAARAPHSLLD